MSKASEEAEPIEAARKALAEGEVQDALRHLRSVFQDPGPEDPERLWLGLEVLAQVGQAMGDPSLPDTIQAALAARQDADAVYQVGYQMIEVGLDAYAGSVLRRALELSPGEDRIVNELVCALERSLDFQGACDVLRAHPALLATGFMPSYLLAFNALMTGDLDEPAALLPALREQAVGDKHTFMVGRIDTALARAEAIRAVTPLDREDLRGWHWVITGSLLSHRSPHGLDAGMNGRYAWLQGTAGLCRLGIERLAAVVEALELELPYVVGLPERGGQILAYAVAQRLGLPLAAWPEGGPEGPALIVGHDLARVDGPVLQPLVTRPPGQLLWVHGTNWTEHFPIVADVTTLLYQQLAPFYEPQMVVNPETQAVGRSEVDERAEEEVAADLLAAEFDADDPPGDLAHLLTVARAAGCGHIQQGGRREAMWFGSPVGSSRFT